MSSSDESFVKSVEIDADFYAMEYASPIWIWKTREMRAAWRTLQRRVDAERARRDEELRHDRAHFPEVNVDGPCDLLLGLALELAAKALIAGHERVAERTTGKFNPPLDKIPAAFRKHKLIELYDDARMPTTKSEQTMLDYFTRQVEWGGRYPAPSSRKEFTHATFYEHERVGMDRLVLQTIVRAVDLFGNLRVDKRKLTGAEYVARWEND